MVFILVRVPWEAEPVTKSCVWGLTEACVATEQEWREGAWKREGGRTNLSWPLLSVTGCWDQSFWRVVHAPSLSCTCVGSGYCVPGAGCRRQEACGTAARWGAKGLHLHKVRVHAELSTAAGKKRKVRPGGSELVRERWPIRRPTSGLSPNPTPPRLAAD